MKYRLDMESQQGLAEHSESNEIKEGKRCCLHAGKSDTDDDHGAITLFKENTLAKCQSVLKQRKDLKLKYSEVMVPEKVNSRDGYHIQCYRRFIALPQKHRVANDKQVTPRTTRQNTVIPEATSSGIFKPVCLFCNQERKRISGQYVKLVNVSTNNFQESIQRFAEWKKDHEMLGRISGIDLIAKEVKYHPYCRSKYQKEAQAASGLSNKEERYWHREREVHGKAFEAIVNHIDNHIIRAKKVSKLTELTSFYQGFIRDIGGEEFNDVVPSTQILEKKLLSFYKDKIKIEKRRTIRGSLVFSSNLSRDEALTKFNNEMESKNKAIREVAILLREEINKTPFQPLPENLKTVDILQGEIKVPALVTEFFQYLIAGPDSRNWNYERNKRRVDSISQDVVFSATSGKKKPTKHLELALNVKSLTGSRKMIEILNRLGHCVSYHTTEELETSLTIEANKEGHMIPDGLKPFKGSGFGVAWDNFDRFVDTFSGKDTLHDTVGIAFQTVNVEVEDNIIQEEAQSDHENLPKKRKKRKRSYEIFGSELQPYRKKPKILEKFIDNQTIIEAEKNHLSLLFDSRIENIIWMFDVFYNDTNTTPMWTGWNSVQLQQESEPPQQVWYLPQINESPTSRSVVQETLKRSLKMANEANRRSICVTYDLAIAKIALQIQYEEKPKFDRVFVALGSFHIEMAFFGAIGKVIAESGGPHILNECEVLAKGSLNSLIKGTHYNRCKRLHEILALAMEILHFQSFANMLDEINQITMKNEINLYLESKDRPFPKEMNQILNDYETYTKKTRDGKHGKTAEFWLKYVDMIHLYHSFSRSQRNGDLQLFIACIPQLTNYFFALNHHNYARWMIRYYHNLLNLPDLHPEVFEEFQNGLFAIKRTTKPFSGSPVDLTLEQTINADASNQKKGITSITNSISARQRWAESHFLRTTLLSHLFADLGLNRKGDVTRDLKPYKIKADNDGLKKILEMISVTMNPFDVADKEHLYNIGTGKAASEETERFLLSVKQIGEEARLVFTDECVDRPERFEERIKRQTLFTFQTEAGKKKLKSKDGKLQAACMMRDIFGSVLRLSLEHRIDMAEVFRYPLTPNPLSLSHADGTKLSSPKVALMKALESKVKSTSPRTIDVTILDAMFFLHLQSNLPETFGGVSRFLLKRIMGYPGKEIHFVTDKWITPSIKDCERENRGSSMLYEIHGPGQKRPSDWLQALRSSTFKQSLIKFLCNIWNEDTSCEILGDKLLFVNNEDICFKYYQTGGIIQKEEIHSLFCTHEEADTRMFYHLSMVEGNKNVVIRTADTDCLVIGLASMGINQQRNVWMEVGVQSKNTQRYISLNQLHKELGENFCRSLPGYHAFTGCDYTASFSKKGKVRPLKILKNPKFTKLFVDVGMVNELTDDMINQFEEFVCLMYGRKTCTNVDDARLQIFLDKYRNKSISTLKQLDGNMLPPCRRSLIQKIKRTMLITKRWLSSTDTVPEFETPCQSGWLLDDNENLKICWYVGNALPPEIEMISAGREDGDEENADDDSDDENYNCSREDDDDDESSDEDE